MDPWTTLSLRLDFSRYVPRPVEPAEAHHVDSERWGRQLVLKSDTGSYLLLSERDEFIYEAMDGTRSVQDLVLEYFHKYESFSFDRVSVLVTRLRESGLLEDPPIEAFSALRDRIERRKTEGRVRRVAGLFFDCRLEIRGIDRAVTLAYKWFFRLFFTRVAYALYAVVAVVGLAAFARIMSEDRYDLSDLYTSSGGSVAYGALTLVATTAFLIFFHQAAHVFAAKSLGREVPCAGFIINYGLPFFYATTTDVWLESRASRIMVSMAGTISDLLLGSAGALFLVACPDSAWGPLVFKLSVVSFAALFMDLNPLFELDGYYALSDYLEIPDLRARSMRFLRRELWGRLKRREALGREGRIFATYGTLALGWTVVIVVAALAFLGMQVRSALGGILAAESWMDVGLHIVVLVFFVIPVTLAVMALAALAVWRAVRWVRGHPAFKDARRLLRMLVGVAVVAGGVVFALPWLVHELVEVPAAAEVGRLLPTERFLPVWGIVYPAVVPVLLAAAAVLALAAAREVRGSRLAGTLRVLAAFLFVEIARSAWESYVWTRGLGGEPTRIVTDALEVGSWAMLAAWALHLLVRVEFPLMGWTRRVVATAAAAGLAGWLVRSTWQFDMGAWEAARLSVAFAATTLAVVALVPALVNYSRTLLWWGWVLALAGLGARSLAGLARLSEGWVWGWTLTAGIQVGLFGAVVLMFGLLIFRALLGRMAVRAHRTERAVADAPGDRGRLVSAFGFLVESLAENLRQAYGHASVRALERTFNRRAKRDGLGVRLEGGRFESPAFESAGILRIAEECRWTLGEIERVASMLAGSRFFHRLVTAVYDELYWNEREPVYEHVLGAFPWAEEVAHLPRPEEGGVDSLIEGAPLFEGLSPEERADLTSRMRPRRARAGERVVREGDPADAFYLISSGELEVFHADAPDEALATLSAGDYFGEAVHEEGARRGASVRAKTEAEVLELDAADYRAFVREHVSVAEKVDEAGEVVGMLRRMPAFREMPLAQVALLASAMKPQRAAAGEEVVRQGDPGTALYVIRSGEVEVLVEREGPAEGPAEGDDRPPKRVAVLGRGEYFGEIALVESVPRTATVRALADCELLTLEKEDFDRRVGKSLAAIQGLGRISSRRRREITERQTDAAFTLADARGGAAS
jgi:putative peptide zinc metalloprotease protein